MQFGRRMLVCCVYWGGGGGGREEDWRRGMELCRIPLWVSVNLLWGGAVTPCGKSVAPHVVAAAAPADVHVSVWPRVDLPNRPGR